MGTRDPRVDAYIEHSRPFAQPILTRLREVAHAACPEVEESMKWGMPHFSYQGMLCGMAAFTRHCAVTFWKGDLIDGLGPGGRAGGSAMGHLGRLTHVDDLPPRKQLVSWIRAARRLNEEGVPRRRAPRAARPEPEVPPVLAAALARNTRARKAFAAFTPGRRREYIQWITDAKRDETRAKRVTQAVEWIAEGKGRNWKYE